MQTITAPNLRLFTKAHENKWVALSPDYTRILSVADTLNSLQEKVAEKDVVVMRVLPSDVGYAPNIRG